jgi:hypothetical protein
MAKTCTQLISRVKQLIGRSGNVNSTLSIDEIILDALNEAQVFIVRRIPNIMELQVKDTATLDTVTDQYEYDLSDFDPKIAHLMNVWIMDGTSSRRLRYKHKDDFDKFYPDVSAIAAAMPAYYTRRGNKIEFDCPVSSDYNGKDIRIDYCKWAAEFTSVDSTEPSELAQADQGLILFAWNEALRVLAKGNTSLLAVANEKKMLFNEWLDEYADYHDMQTEDLTEEYYGR